MVLEQPRAQDMATQLYAWDVVLLRYFKGANSLTTLPTQCIKTHTGYDIVWGQESPGNSLLDTCFVKLRINRNTFILTYSVGQNGARGFQSYLSCGPCVTRINELLLNGS